MTFIAMPVQSCNLVVTHVFLGSPASLYSGVTLERVFLHILEDVHRASASENSARKKLGRQQVVRGGQVMQIWVVPPHQYTLELIVISWPTFWFGGVGILPLTSCIPPKPTNRLAAEMITDK